MNLQEIRRTLDIFKAAGIFEIRTVKSPILSGYFNSVDKAIECISSRPEETWYFVLNEIDENCFSREQSGKVIAKPKNTTSDKEIVGRDWILIDADPRRISNVSSTAEEKNKSKCTIGRVYKYLNELGFEKPVVADSGNGYHLLYRISSDNEQYDANLVKNFLLALDMLFTDEFVSIDTAVFNASRITKLYGVMATKGANTADRPHRQSKILRVPEEIKKTRLALIEKVADTLPKPEPKQYNAPRYGETFDARQFINKQGIKIAREVSTEHGIKFVLDECVFDSNHKSPDAAIFLRNDGAIGYKCFHNSCSQYQWHDVRLKFEPQAYDNKQFAANKPSPNYNNSAYEPVKVKIEPNGNDEPKFYTTAQIKALKTPPQTFVRTGITQFDKITRGLCKGEVTCVSGLRGGGKSSLLSQICLEAIEQGYRAALYSGELTAQRANEWLELQAAGKDYINSTQYDNFFKVRESCIKPITDWTNEKIYVYNNHYGNEIQALLQSLNECVAQHKIDLVILDNLMALNLASLDPIDKYRQQSLFVELLETFAKANNVHIVFVAHPRKSTGFLRLDDISGSGDITNRVDNAVIVHRVNEDFKRLTQQMFKWNAANPLYLASNVVEICKDRAGGTQDEFIPLYFEKSSKRLRNNEYENKNYSWLKQKSDFVQLKNDETLPFMKG